MGLPGAYLTDMRGLGGPYPGKSATENETSCAASSGTTRSGESSSGARTVLAPRSSRGGARPGGARGVEWGARGGGLGVGVVFVPPPPEGLAGGGGRGRPLPGPEPGAPPLPDRRREPVVLLAAGGFL